MLLFCTWPTGSQTHSHKFGPYKDQTSPSTLIIGSTWRQSDGEFVDSVKQKILNAFRRAPQDEAAFINSSGAARHKDTVAVRASVSHCQCSAW